MEDMSSQVEQVNYQVMVRYLNYPYLETDSVNREVFTSRRGAWQDYMEATGNGAYLDRLPGDSRPGRALRIIKTTYSFSDGKKYFVQEDVTQG